MLTEQLYRQYPVIKFKNYNANLPESVYNQNIFTHFE